MSYPSLRPGYCRGCKTPYSRRSSWLRHLRSNPSCEAAGWETLDGQTNDITQTIFRSAPAGHLTFVLENPTGTHGSLVHTSDSMSEGNLKYTRSSVSPPKAGLPYLRPLSQAVELESRDGGMSNTASMPNNSGCMWSSPSPMSKPGHYDAPTPSYSVSPEHSDRVNDFLDDGDVAFAASMPSSDVVQSSSDTGLCHSLSPHPATSASPLSSPPHNHALSNLLQFYDHLSHSTGSEYSTYAARVVNNHDPAQQLWDGDFLYSIFSPCANGSSVNVHDPTYSAAPSWHAQSSFSNLQCRCYGTLSDSSATNYQDEEDPFVWDTTTRITK